MYEKTEMRAVFANALEKMMETDKSIIVMDADLARANGTLGLHANKPEQTVNVGIAESNMASIAAGMASYGFKPFIFSFCPFVTRRICDQVAISIAYAEQNVKIVGTDPGISAEFNGGTHISVEDIGVMRSIPGMVIFEPVDGNQLAKAMPAIIEYQGPMYIRLFRKVAPKTFFKESYDFSLFGADTLREGEDVTLFASGIEVKQAMEAAEILAQDGIKAEVVNIHTIKPINADAIIRSVQKTGCAVTCENHNILGGLGSAVAEVLVSNYLVPLEFIGIKDHFSEVGKMPCLLEKYKMDAASIAEAAKKSIARKN